MNRLSTFNTLSGIGSLAFPKCDITSYRTKPDGSAFSGNEFLATPIADMGGAINTLVLVSLCIESSSTLRTIPDVVAIRKPWPACKERQPFPKSVIFFRMAFPTKSDQVIRIICIQVRSEKPEGNDVMDCQRPWLVAFLADAISSFKGNPSLRLPTRTTIAFVPSTPSRVFVAIKSHGNNVSTVWSIVQ